MNHWTRLFSRRQRMMEALDQDIRNFIERETQDNIERGLSPEEARYAALRKFGNVTRIREETRDVWSFVWLEQLWQDIRSGLRQLRRTPSFTMVAVFTLALGIGANTAMYTVINDVLLRPLPYASPSRIVWITEVMPDFSRDTVLCPEYAAWLRVKGTFDQLGAFQVTRGVNLTGGPEPERIMAGHVDAGFFSVLGVQSVVGRTFLLEEGGPGRDHLAVISYGLWQSYFHADPEVLGRSLWLDGERYTVIGVMPRQLSIPAPTGNRFGCRSGYPLKRQDPPVRWVS